MPLVEYSPASDPSVRVERLFLAGDGPPPESIEVPGHGVCKRVFSSSAVHFKGAFSGGTTTANGLVQDRELVTPREAREHARRQKGYKQEAEKRARRKAIDSLASGADF